MQNKTSKYLPQQQLHEQQTAGIDFEFETKLHVYYEPNVFYTTRMRKISDQMMCQCIRLYCVNSIGLVHKTRKRANALFLCFARSFAFLRHGFSTQLR